jgi:DNA-binding transcriptional regulator LsrR (DeoR family)
MHPLVISLSMHPQVRALLDQEEFARVLQYRKRKDHFIFTIGELDKGRTIVEVGTGIRKANSRAGKKKSN